MATVLEVSSHLFLTDRRFRQLVEEGVIGKRPRGEYDVDEVRRQYIEHLRNVAAGRGLNSELDLTEERAKLAREQADGIALKNAIARGEYVAIDDVVDQVEREYGTVRERMLTIPGKVADEIAGQDRETVQTVLEREVTEALHELHEPAVGGRGGPG